MVRYAKLPGKATSVVGGRGGAERWMLSIVMGLDRERPIELLLTRDGAQRVDYLLARLEYCVYT